MMFDSLRLRGLGLFLILASLLVVPARADEGVARTWRLLDYVAVDYPGAVQDGRIVSQFEYDEMREFSATVETRIAALPDHRDRPALLAAARGLKQAVEARAAPPEVERQARALGAALLRAYPVPMAPDRVPDAARGEALYQENCAACHGADGKAAGPAAAALDPPPIDFTDRARARERSLFALYQVTSQGLEGTSMQSFAHLPEADRWALAFRVGRFVFTPEEAEAGRALWRDPEIRRLVPDLDALVALTPAALSARIGEPRAIALMAYLRSDPEALVGEAAPGSSLAIARQRLEESVAAYRAGRRDQASELALSAYLDGFEPVESVLGARDGRLVAAVEREMGLLRAAIGRGRPPAEVEAIAARLQTLFAESETAIAPDTATSVTIFLGAFAILLREGLEALLIVVALLTLLRRAERREFLPYVHFGWISALLAGFVTWLAATSLVEISGASRELTEGFGALLAAIILVFVGLWMHDKAQAGAWQAYVQQRLDTALGRGSAWLLFGLSFLVVYREVFETIIFYAALGAQGEGAAMAAGIAAAVLALAIIAWAMVRFARRLPIGQFFRYSAWLIAILAVVLAGKGVAALQEAGMIGVTPLLHAPRLPLVGLFPTAETIAAQLLALFLLGGGMMRARRREALAS